MNKEIEEIIVKTFFIKGIQQRTLFELTSNKYRHSQIARITDPLDCFRKDLISEIPKPNSDPDEIEKILKKQGAGKMCYVMTSIISDMDGKEMPLTEALENLIWCGMPFIISCIPNKLLYFQGEQSYGPLKVYFKKAIENRQSSTGCFNFTTRGAVIGSPFLFLQLTGRIMQMSRK